MHIHLLSKTNFISHSQQLVKQHIKPITFIIFTVALAILAVRIYIHRNFLKNRKIVPLASSSDSSTRLSLNHTQSPQSNLREIDPHISSKHPETVKKIFKGKLFENESSPHFVVVKNFATPLGFDNQSSEIESESDLSILTNSTETAPNLLSNHPEIDEKIFEGEPSSHLVGETDFTTARDFDSQSPKLESEIDLSILIGDDYFNDEKLDNNQNQKEKIASIWIEGLKQLNQSNRSAYESLRKGYEAYHTKLVQARQLEEQQTESLRIANKDEFFDLQSDELKGYLAWKFVKNINDTSFSCLRLYPENIKDLLKNYKWPAKIEVRLQALESLARENPFFFITNNINLSKIIEDFSEKDQNLFYCRYVDYERRILKHDPMHSNIRSVEDYDARRVLKPVSTVKIDETITDLDQPAYFNLTLNQVNELLEKE